MVQMLIYSGWRDGRKSASTSQATHLSMWVLEVVQDVSTPIAPHIFGIEGTNLWSEQYAIIEASYTLVRILQTFSRLESKNRDEWEERISMTLGNHNGVNVSFFRQ